MRLALVCLGAVGGGIAAWLLWQTSVPDIELVEVAAPEVFAADVLREGDEYRAGTRAFWAGSVAVQIVVLALFAWRARSVVARVETFGRGRVRTAVLVAALAVLAVWLAMLPISAGRHAWRRSFDITGQTYSDWFVDSAGNLLVTAFLVVLAVALVVWLAGRLGSGWWPVAGLAIAACGFLFVVLQPIVVEPLFNDFAPVEDARLEAEVGQLAAAVGVEIGGVEIRDQSRRTRVANAQVTGLGPSRRVVVDDTLLGADAFDRAQVRAVVAHELAHVARRHVWKGVAWFALIVVPAAGLLALILRRIRPGGAADPVLVPAGLLVALLIFLATLPLQNAVSRRYEAEADWIALRATQDPDAFEKLMEGFVVTNVGDPTRPGWVTQLLGTHPSTLERIGMARASVG